MRTSCIFLFISLIIYISIAEPELSQRTELEKESNNGLLERNVRAPGKNGNLRKEKKNRGKVSRKKSKSKNIKNKKMNRNKTKNKGKRKNKNNVSRKDKGSKNKKTKGNKRKNISNKKKNSKTKKNSKKNNTNNRSKKKPNKKTKKISKTEKKQKKKANNSKTTDQKRKIKTEKVNNKKTKVISKLKRNKEKGNIQNKVEKTKVESRQSSSTCEATMCSMAKKFNTYQTQYRKASRIESWVSLTGNKKTKAATTFSNASTSIRESTNNGTGCGGGTINDEAMTANTKLQACSTSATALCESSAEVNSSSTTLISDCKPLLKTFIDGYKECLKDCSSACSCMEALALVDSKCTKFNDLETAMKTRKDLCIKSSNEGSFGDCRKQERHTAYYSNQCKTSCSGSVTTMAPGGRKKYLRDLMLKKDLK